MNVLMVGGTRFFGKHAVRELIALGHNVTIATRGTTPDDFGDAVQRIHLDRANPDAVREKLSGMHFDAVLDNICYSSNDVRSLLDNVSCDRYVLTSSASVYVNHMDTHEEDFDPLNYPLVWCNREDYSYEEIKRQTETALFQAYPHVNGVAIRFPYVVGPDDYSGRFRFYIDHVMTGTPMHITNMDSTLGFIRAQDAGHFLVQLMQSDFRGTINGGSPEGISVGEMLQYVTERTGKTPVLSLDGDEAPYNPETPFTLNVERAAANGMNFPPLKDWIYGLIDHFIAENA